MPPRRARKSNDVLGEISKIPAANVVRIEIVDGARLDIPGLSRRRIGAILSLQLSGKF